MDKLRVLQFEGLAPSVFCGQYFSDLGSDVVIIARHKEPTFGIPINQNLANRNKKCICLSLKSDNDLEIIKHLIRETDIVIDSFRPGVLEKVGLGYKDIFAINKKAILLRVSGYGQEGSLALRPGHDLNYIGVSGFLSKINPKGKPSFPNNYLADFASASLGIMGVMIALVRREESGVGDMVDCSLMHGTKYLSSFLDGYEQQTQLKVSKEKDGQSVEFAPTYGKAIKTKVIQMPNLLSDKSLIDYQKHKLIAKSNNPFNFVITSPFASETNAHLSDISPHRGQHTVSYLTSRHVPLELIQQSINPKARL